MSKASGLTRGDKRRNQRLGRLRGAVPRQNAVVAVDLGEDTQMLVVADHDSRVLARKVDRVKAYRLGAALEWAAAQAARHGFASVTVVCEPTGSRWMQVADLAAARDLAFQRRVRAVSAGLGRLGAVVMAASMPAIRRLP